MDMCFNKFILDVSNHTCKMYSLEKSYKSQNDCYYPYSIPKNAGKTLPAMLNSPKAMFLGAEKVV